MELSDGKRGMKYHIRVDWESMTLTKENWRCVGILFYLIDFAPFSFLKLSLNFGKTV